MEIIVLYWMRWTGKSTIWKKLAFEKWYDFVDLDNYILWKAKEQFFEISKLSEYIDKAWWEEFRNKEHEFLKEVLNKQIFKWKSLVFSLWWWTVIFERNIEVLNAPSLIRRGLEGGLNLNIIYLETSLEKIASRIEQDEKSWNTRNSLTWKSVLEELEEIFEKRKEIYKSNCDFSVDNNWTLEQTLQEIKQKLNYWWICIPITSLEKVDEIYEKIKFDRKIKFVELRLDLIFERNYLLPPKIGGKQVSSSPILGDYKVNLNILKEFIKKCPKKVICTNRASFEWWNFNWTPEQSLELLSKCLEFWADFVDVELKTLEKIQNVKIFQKSIQLSLLLSKNGKGEVVISFHDFQKTPSLEELENVLKKMQKFSPKVYKIACMPQEKSDVQKIYDLVKKVDWSFCFISMWELWLETRIKTLSMKNCFMSFWSFWENISAPWQIDYIELYKQVYYQDKAYSKQSILFWQSLEFHEKFTLENINNLNFSDEIKEKLLESKDYLKQVFFLWAEQISGSFSPFMHNFSSSFLSNEKKFFYTLTPVLSNYEKTSKEIVKEFVDFLESNENYLWWNVTMPYKINMFEYLETLWKLDLRALLVWAVNTLYKKNWKIFWTNTDIDWVKNPILEKLFSDEKVFSFVWDDTIIKYNAIVLWAWWASRSAIWALIEMWIKSIYVLNRSKENLDDLEKHFSKFLKEEQKLYTMIYDVSSLDSLFEIIEKNSLENLLIINTLPFWFKENLPKSPILLEELEKILEKTLLYFEAVYDSRKWNTPIVEKILEYNKILSRDVSMKHLNEIKVCKWVEMLIWQAKTWFEFWSEWWEFQEKFIKESLAFS